ncbi:uncharacterized protein LOC129777541 [Toxorhynchites rutilus septentrionalis]|uniref:uncharacterized protein LOC129777541 n=1 Tax=Toxorhynchites rutilus septentrionalis TaxID=329112 RepID=UPI0024797779|nr:uncharacterized protein LOC129777541 [Toxorhynchites rutilus septentrionalis]
MLTVLWNILAITAISFCDSSQQVGSIPEPVCGQISLMLDNCFYNTTPRVAADLLYSVKIPETEEEINGRCLVFNRGMECVQRYLNACLESKERNIIENEVYGARKLYGFLCRDKSFQREFLKHKACFHHVHNDWDACSSKFVNILKDEMMKTTQQSFNMQYMHFCCARYGYETCVFTSARYKCKLDSAIFLRKIAKLLSTDKHFLNCDRIENEICSSAGRPLPLGVTVPRGVTGPIPMMLLLVLLLQTFTMACSTRLVCR